MAWQQRCENLVDQLRSFPPPPPTGCQPLDLFHLVLLDKGVMQLHRTHAHTTPALRTVVVSRVTHHDASPKDLGELNELLHKT